MSEAIVDTNQQPISAWETAINGAPASEQADTQTVETVPLAQDLTTAPQLDADESAREAEATPQVTQETESAESQDEDIQEGDPAELSGLPTPSQKKWARRQFQDAAPLRTFLDFEQPIAGFSEDLYQRSQSRYKELVDDIAVNHLDYLSQKMYGVSYEKGKQRFASGAQTDAQTTTHPTQPDNLPLSETELGQLDWQAQEKLAAYQEAQAQKEQAWASEKVEMQKRLDALEGKFTSKEQQEQQEALQARQQKAVESGQKLYSNVWGVVEQGIKDSGLEVSKDDPPRIQHLKQAAAEILRMKSEPTFDSEEENTKLVGLVMEALNRGEESNAFREEDNLKVRARAAFEKVKSSPEVKALLDEIESFANSKQKRGIPPPPVPGAAAGVTVQQPRTWDEAVAR